MEKLSWLERLAGSLDQHAGESARVQVMLGSERMSSGSAPGPKARWVCEMLARIEQLTDEDTRAQVMVACHCRFPQAILRRMRGIYEQTHQINRVIEALQAERCEELRRRIGGDAFLWEKAQTQPFFTSPIREGKRVIHITAPYHPWTYLKETEFARQRAEYCHCGWINGSKENIPRTFCFCGAGFYQELWEGVLGAPVTVAVLQTVFSGGQDCRLQVTLPDGVE